MAGAVRGRIAGSPILATVLALVALGTVGCHTAVAIENDSVAPRVYFLGVDAEPAGDSISRLTTAGEGGRWAFTEFGRDALRTANASSVTHNLTQWRALDDPYNVALIVVESVRVWPESYKGIAFREYATADVVWIHIGQDIVGLGMGQPFPEVRASISHFYTDFTQSSVAITESQRDEPKKRAVERAIEQLAARVAKHERAAVLRRGSEIQYVTVAPAAAQRRARAGLDTIYGDRADTVEGLLRKRIAQLTEWMLMDRIMETDDLDHVVLLPRSNTLDVITRMWPIYAGRIFSQSEYSGARRALGEAPPKLRAVGAACETRGDPRLVEVPGWHLRTTLLAMDSTSGALSNYSSEHNVQVVTASRLRVPLTEAAYLKDDNGQEAVIGKSENLRLQESNEVGLGRALTERHLNELLAESIAETLPQTLAQLVSLKNAPGISSAYRKHCHD